MILSVNNLSKSYNYKPLHKNARGLFALKDVSFSLDKGEALGIIGENGSGKSTLLKLLCGITAPTSGSFSANGKVSALLELGTGFNPEYDGISNIYLTGMLYGLSKKETEVLIPEIEAFADIGDFIKKPVKTYSDGMFLRLAFSCATAVKPDILIIDEALAVGDFKFRQKCFQKIEELKKQGTSIILVSHDINIIRRFCDRAIWLDKGRLIKDGSVFEVSGAYMESITGGVSEKTYKSEKNRFGSSIGSVTSVNIKKILTTGETAKILCRLDIPTDIDLKNLALSISIKDEFGRDITVISTYDENIRFTKSGIFDIEFNFKCSLCKGIYSLAVSLENRGTTPIKYYDYIDLSETFQVVSDKEYFGVFKTDTEIIMR